jgi:excisionase family DNA binding protein
MGEGRLMEDLDRFVGVNAIAERLDVSRDTVYRLIRHDNFPVPVFRIGGSVKVNERQLLEWMNGQGCELEVVA